ncbi:MAG: DUF6960 family protein [Pirellulaceae bacterium]
MSAEFDLPPLKRPPVYGVFRWWPEDGEEWIHPFDIGIVRQLVPGNRVFRREDLDDDYLLISYGDIQFRVHSTIWYEIDYEGFDVGDNVEIKSRMGQADPFIGRIKDMFWNHRYKQIEYYLYRNEAIQVRAYEAADLMPADAIKPNGDGQEIQ